MSSVITSIQRSLRQPGFVVIVVVMGICAATMNAFVAFKAVHFKKLPVPLRVKSLREGLPAEFGDWHDKDLSGHDRLRHDRWVMVSTDHAIDPDIEHVLLTSEYVFSRLRRQSKVAREDIERLKSEEGTTGVAAQCDVNGTAQDKPAAVMRAAVTYYRADRHGGARARAATVADGFEISASKEVRPASGNIPTYRFLVPKTRPPSASRCNASIETWHTSSIATAAIRPVPWRFAAGSVCSSRTAIMPRLN